MQNTLKTSVVFEGTGLHSGAPVRMVLHAAAANHGIWFRRTDIHLGDAMVPAIWDAVDRT
ncbi:MAG: UDP-3-O-[3-hydroxymyristoyl] N-acetylglucosamine deacetylase, partial [Granulosicoccus sp.]